MNQTVKNKFMNFKLKITVKRVHYCQFLREIKRERETGVESEREKRERRERGSKIGSPDKLFPLILFSSPQK